MIENHAKTEREMLHHWVGVKTLWMSMRCVFVCTMKAERQDQTLLDRDMEPTYHGQDGYCQYNCLAGSWERQNGGGSKILTASKFKDIGQNHITKSDFNI